MIIMIDDGDEGWLIMMMKLSTSVVHSVNYNDG